METDLKNYNYGEADEKTDDVERLMKKKDFQYYLIYEGYKSLMNADEKEYRNADTQEDKMAAARLRDKTREEFIKECIALDYKRERGLLGKD